MATTHEQPFRSELFSLEALRRHARHLAQTHQVGSRRRAPRLLARLASNEKILQAYNKQTLRVEGRRPVTPAAEWLLDNFHLLEEQIRTARRHLPKGYSRELPHLVQGVNAGLPRVYDLALELITHVDGRIDAAHLAAFVAAYQEVTPLKLGELWAIPIMVRLGLIENLRRAAALLTDARADRDLADEWAGRLLSVAESNPSQLIVAVGWMAHAGVPLTEAFVAEFWRCTQQKSVAFKLAIDWVEERLSEEGMSVQQLIQSENQNQAANQVSVGNSITSLRALDAIDWREFVETLSVVELALREDAAGQYAEMDFATRDHYRHVVEAVARHSRRPELEIARMAVEMGRAAETAQPEEFFRRHVGFYLLDRGRRELEKATGARVPVREALARVVERFPLGIYLGAITVLTLFSAWCAWRLAAMLEPPVWVLALTALLLVICSSHLAVALVNWLATLLLPPQSLPRMDFSEGVPAEHRTLVVVPSMLSSPESTDRLLEALEVRYLANRDASIYFALLTDWCDAPEERMPADEELLERAWHGITALNEKYRDDRPGIFYLFHRPRRWNAVEHRWMGYERKRGKLADLNRVLRGGDASCFRVITSLPLLPHIQYVLTLDSDTQLPRDAARQLAGAMAHPLNRPLYDGGRGRVVRGYSILQPRVAVSLSGASRSYFARLFSGDPGIDPYTRAVSDVYQDLFREGSFIGKGIYDVDMFERSVGLRFPENRILSHDLLEGSYARCGLVTDVQLFEEFPAHYTADMRRRHRWMRGDWQIASWLLPRVPGSDVRRVVNPISGLSRWKIFDNLRRSLVSVALVALLVLGWLALARFSGMWTALVVAIIFLPGLLMALSDLLALPEELPFGMHLRNVRRTAGQHLGQALCALTFLPYDAGVSLDATVRTATRLLCTGRNLLEWETAGDTERRSGTDLRSFWATMWCAPVLAVVLGILLALFGAGSAPFAAPILLLWFLSPVAAWWISRPREDRQSALNPGQQQALRLVARRTWRFFETFVTPEDHWLPPDNFQEEPKPMLATRTSPTNIGIAMLSTLAAWDFGYLTLEQLTARLRGTLETLASLPRYNGQLYNWYDTRTLEPLPPLYVSTVDNGNLAGLLLTLREGLLELVENPFCTRAALDGLRDTLGCWDESVSEDGFPNREPNRPERERLREILSQPVSTLAETAAVLDRLVEQLAELPATPDEPDSNTAFWRQAFEKLVHGHRSELHAAFPWIAPSVERSTTTTAESERGQNRNGNGSPRVGAPSDPGVSLSREELVTSLQVLLDEGSTGDGSRVTAAKMSRPAPTPTDSLREGLLEALTGAEDRAAELRWLAAQCDVQGRMDFTLLYDSARKLFSIGYNVTQHRMDVSCYDLLASEARLASFVAISLGQVPQEHWFTLGRLLTAFDTERALISWSGSMFEYLMPALIMPSYEQTLLDTSCRAAIHRQIRYGRDCGVPWGISESGYNVTDAQANYQYRAFGVPGLGFKRGLADDLVIAPYATLLSFLFDPLASWDNLQRLRDTGAEGRFGFYEALDFTSSRLPPDATCAVVRSFMAHHEGMALLALTACLLDRPMQRRFLANPLFRATDLLLQERVPHETTLMYPHAFEPSRAREAIAVETGTFRVVRSPESGPPEVHLLSNGRYHVMLTGAGGGYSHWNEIALTRWREDPTRDCWGTFLYLRDRRSGEVWSAAHQPVRAVDARTEAVFSQGRAEFRVRYDEVDSHLEIAVSPEDDVEVRRLTVTNHSGETREIEVTSFAEVVLGSAMADQAHPAFSKLFVQTEILSEHHAILCSRRPRASGEQPPWMLHRMLLQGDEIGVASFETDRARFLGRNRDASAPLALSVNILSNTSGAVLDPAVAIRRVVRLAPKQNARFTLVTGSAAAREPLLGLLEKYGDPSIADRVFELAWTHGLVALRHLNATEPQAQLFARLAGFLLYTHAFRRPPSALLMRNRRGQRNLWSLGISGDLPILLVNAMRPDALEFMREILTAHTFWRFRGLAVDLVIVHQDESVYRQSVHDQIVSLVTSGIGANMFDRPGGVFVRRIEQISEEDRVLLHCAARLVLSDTEGSLAEQMQRRPRVEQVPSTLMPTRPRRTRRGFATNSLPPDPDLRFFNGLGGFTPDGREYVIHLEPGNSTPAPWVNVLGNPEFGTLISESGSAYSWAWNCHEYRLTPWHNDPVSDPSGEAFYLRDESTGHYWSPMPWPAGRTAACRVRHGFGYSVFEMTEDGIASEVWAYVAMDAPMKFVRIKLRNLSERGRVLSITAFWEWVLGEFRSRNLPHVATEFDGRIGALLAGNAFNSDFAECLAFVSATEPVQSFTGSRTEFIGRNGSLDRPAAMGRQRLGGKWGAGLDACAALRIEIVLEPGGQREVWFKLGATRGRAEAEALLQRFKWAEPCRLALDGVHAYWAETLSALQVDTPDPALDVLTNGWLLYQVISGRLFARTGFYQSGGAYGYRDQLQDTMALIHARPQLLRDQLLRAAAHQFREGDVQHWWHPPGSRGVRTHFSDDYLWLPYAVCRYVQTIGDSGVLDERVPFLEGRLLRPNEEAAYESPGISSEQGTLYEHCVRAIRHGLRFGEHGLPLMGCGDWNDGMNRVGEGGKGESVWLGFFLYDVLRQFAVLARARADREFADVCDEEARLLRDNIERHAWDGRWYRRAFFDDGKPLGSASNTECQIDSLPQSWSIFSGIGVSKRGRAAMDAVNERLVKRDLRLIQLFDPPFDHSALDPGYIKGYLPGVRENGGQYTHGAIWTIMAFAAMGDRDRAWELFDLINPVRHADTPTSMARYRVEPYVVAADVYSAPGQAGRGGWTWYTGSAAWMYRLITESLLGVRREGDRLEFAPCLPSGWKSFRVRYQFRGTRYSITVRDGDGRSHPRDVKPTIVVDGVVQTVSHLELNADGREHTVEVRLS